MEPNLLIGDHLLVNKFVAAPTLSKVEDTLLPIETIRRGDIIVFKHPKMPERDLIKRTIGLPGETIELRDRRVYVNGQPLDEPYAHFLFKDLADVPAGDVRRNFGPVTIPQGQYFMTRDEALASFTRHAAFAAHAETQLGTLEAGKLADLVVLSKDIMRVAPSEILTTTVRMTIVGGEVVYNSTP